MECDAGITAVSLSCPMCNTAIDREKSVMGLVVCVECDADIKAASLPCLMCNTAINRDGSVAG